jgi:YfiH family protein
MQSTWEWKNNEGMQYLTLPAWQARGVNLYFSSRHGGVSKHPYEALNLSLKVGDQEDNVLTNRIALIDAIGGDLRNVVCCEQVYEHQVAVVDKTDRGRGAIQLTDVIPGCDAMITNTPGVILMGLFADNLPIYFFDPFKRVIGLAHFGYNGKYGQITWETAKKMTQVFRCNYWDIEVFIGPGLCKSCNLISEDKAHHLKDAYPLLNDFICKTDKGFSWDMISTNRRMLEIQGINPEKISSCNLCTSCGDNHFFSKARDGITGRMAAVISLDR